MKPKRGFLTPKYAHPLRKFGNWSQPYSPPGVSAAGVLLDSLGRINNTIKLQKVIVHLFLWLNGI